VVKFESLSIAQPVLQALSDMGFTEASPIQEAAIPFLLEGRDLIGQAQTGTGKTAAFGIPLVMAAMEERFSLVLVPTRELCQQVAAELDRIGAVAGVKSLPLYGGAAFGPQANAIASGRFSILVATPGRLRDHLERRTLDASVASIIVLDEADEMLDMGFIDEVEEILKALPAQRQTLLFSATMAEPIVRLSERYLKDPEFVQVQGANDSVATENTTQYAVQVDHHEKLDALVRIMAAERPTGTLVFRHTREMVDELADQLRAKGVAVEALHGGMPQGVRDAVLGRFRDGRVKVLVATNVAARGLDVEGLSHVVNYDAPREAEAYVHRIGRTGRAGREGRAFLFCTPADRGRLRGIERVLGARLEWYEVPGDEQVHAAIAKNTAAWLGEQALHASEMHLSVVDEVLATGANPRILAAKLLGLLAKHEGLEAPELAPRRERRVRVQNNNPQRAPSNAPRVALSFSVGRDDGLRPGDLVGALANEGGLVGAEVGRIDILPRMSVAEVPADRVEDLLDTMSRATIRGRPVQVRVAERWEFRSMPRGGAPQYARPMRR
jgi:ATP-dependent RNA helicase DeaD